MAYEHHAPFVARHTPATVRYRTYRQLERYLFHTATLWWAACSDLPQVPESARARLLSDLIHYSR